MSEEQPAAEVDARGLACPMPVIDLAAAVRAADVGATVRLVATDPTTKVDVPVWCRMQGQRLDDATESDGVFTYVVVKTGEVS